MGAGRTPLSYLRRLQHCQRVGHSGKGLVGLLDIQGELFNCVGGRGSWLLKVKGEEGGQQEQEPERKEREREEREIGKEGGRYGEEQKQGMGKRTRRHRHRGTGERQ